MKNATFLNDVRNNFERKESIWNNELWSQKEVAKYFRVTTNTVTNWRKKGLLSYWQAPGSARKLYFRDEILDFKNTNSNIKKVNVSKQQKILNKEKHVISSKIQNEEWRI